MFVDRAEIWVHAGKGGNGCVSFRREKYVPRGGPDGGDGGHGGSIIMVADASADNLAFLAHRKQWKAESGKPGSGSNRHGRSGTDLTLPVPPGTVVRDAEAGHIIKDLAREGDRVTVAQGGRGGRGNLHYKSSTNRAPRTAMPGEAGEVRHLLLELKLIADVGIIGKPNAGKSTLLSRLSRARPRIADYPFTTKQPNLGLIQVDLDNSFVMADIPGLVENAHAGVGLGHEFLRHVERTRLLVHLVEPEPTDGTDPLENYRAIRHELSCYSPALADKPEVVAISKSELPGSSEIQAQLAEALDQKVLAISSVTGEGLNDLTRRVVRDLAELERTEAESSSSLE